MRLKVKNIIMMLKRGHQFKIKVILCGKRSENVHIIKSEQTLTGRIDSAVTHDLHHWTGP